MLMFLGYGVALWVFLIGLMGLRIGVFPGLTIVPRSGLRMKLAGLIMLIPLPLAIWWGQRETSSDEIVHSVIRMHDVTRKVLRESIDLNAEYLPESKKVTLARLHELETEVKEVQDRSTTLVSGRFEELDAYERCFDRLFFSILAVVIAIAMLPPPMERPSREGLVK